MVRGGVNMKKQYLIKVTFSDKITKTPKTTNTRIFYRQCKSEEIKDHVKKVVEWYKGLSGVKVLKVVCEKITETKTIDVQA